MEVKEIHYSRVMRMLIDLPRIFYKKKTETKKNRTNKPDPKLCLLGSA